MRTTQSTITISKTKRPNHNGIRFYLEFNSSIERRKGISAGNVFAAFTCNGRNHDGGYDGVGAVFLYPNSPVASTGTSFGYQNSFRLKRISQTQARAIHPNLFYALDGMEAARSDKPITA